MLEKYNYVMNIKPDVYDLSNDSYSVFLDYTKRFKEMQDYNYKSCLSNMYFYTITFDPDRFGGAVYLDSERDYILHKLALLLRDDLIFTGYGCFECHKNGKSHAHVILHTNEPKKVYTVLKKCFTNNPYNKCAIDYGPAK